MSCSGLGFAKRACAAAIGSAVALCAIGQTSPDQVQVGLERAIKTPTEILWLRDEILAELWRRNPYLADSYGPCTDVGAPKMGCTIGERPASRYAMGNGTYADMRFRPLTSGVYLIAPRADKGGLIRAPSGEILLAAGASVQLIDAAYPGILIELSAPPDQPLPLGNLSAAEAGKVFGLLARQPGMVNANAASVLGDGRVAFKSPAGETQIAAAKRIETLALRPAATLQAPVQIAAAAPASPAPPVVRPTEFRGTIDVSRIEMQMAVAKPVEPQVVQPAAVAPAPVQVAAAAPVPRILPSTEFRGTIDVSRAVAPPATVQVAASAPAPLAPPVLPAAEFRGTFDVSRAKIPPLQPLVFAGVLNLRSPPAAPVAEKPQRVLEDAQRVATANPDLARLRAEVEAEIERDRVRLASAQQQACSGTLRPGQNCTISTPRRFSFAG